MLSSCEVDLVVAGLWQINNTTLTAPLVAETNDQLRTRFYQAIETFTTYILSDDCHSGFRILHRQKFGLYLPTL